MHNLKTNFDKILETVKQFSKNLVNEKGNTIRRGVIPKFSDTEVIALSLTAEALGIDSENYLFHKLNNEYAADFSNLISRRQYNQRRKLLFNLTNSIRTNIATAIDRGESYFCIDSKPIPVCRISRAKRCKMGKDHYEQAPSYGYCAAQKSYYYGYKLHGVCGLSGVIHSFDLTKAAVHDIHYLQDVKQAFSNCTLIGDRGYLSAPIQLDLFETARIELSVPYRSNQKNYQPKFKPFAKARKRIETIFSQLDDQFMLVRNYAKQHAGLFVRVLAKISALTVLQYFNKINNNPIGQVKYALI